MNHSYLLIGMTFGRLMRMIIRNGGFSIKYIGRFFLLLQASLWSSLFARIEKFKHHKALKRHRGITNPIIITGHWRTGSTFLHQLLSLDKQFCVPTVVQTSVPDSFLVSEPYFSSVMKKVMSKTRPMDNVKLGPDEPQEDEYALLKMAKNTPLEQLVFPQKNTSFASTLKNIEPAAVSEQQLSKVQLFANKLHYKSDGRIVLKNPLHSFRIKALKKAFPNACFIHIYRHPYKVIPSTANMLNIVGRQNIMKGKWVNEDIASVTKSFNHMWDVISGQLSELTTDSYIEIKYETLEKEPKECIKAIYKHFGLELSQEYESTLDEHIIASKTYKKNKFSLSAEETDYIDKACKKFINHYNYASNSTNI